MIHSTSILQSGDGLELFIQDWSPEDDIKAVCILVHGLGDHSGRYTHLVKFLIESGIKVGAFDLRGHGRSQGKRGHSHSYNHLMDDIGLVLSHLWNVNPNLPVFLYGHSMGGNLVINYALRKQSDLVGVISASPALRPAFEPPALKIKAGRILYSILPSLTLNNELDLSGVSRDDTVITAYKADPLVHDRLSARLVIDLLDSGEWALDQAAKFSVPLLLMHGTDDKLTSHDVSHEFSQKTENCTFYSFSGLYHELHNEPEKDQVFTVIGEWLDERLN